jgi:hypothetical protein
MDLGSVYFTNTTRLDLTRAMAFRNSVLFCVAPIVSADTEQRVDFWAVGTDCCDGYRPRFRCGEYANPRARAGVRTLHNYQRPFLRLAVQQAEAAYNLTAPHPVFVTWTEDPLKTLNTYRYSGIVWFIFSSLVVFIINVVLVASAAMVFAKLGAQ